MQGILTRGPIIASSSLHCRPCFVQLSPNMAREKKSYLQDAWVLLASNPPPLLAESANGMVDRQSEEKPHELLKQATAGRWGRHRRRGRGRGLARRGG